MAGGILGKESMSKSAQVEIVDLTSDDESDTGFLTSLTRETTGDAPPLVIQDGEESGEDQWESASLYEDALDEVEDDRLFDVGEGSTKTHKHKRQIFDCTPYALVEDSCTLEEALAFRRRLRHVGEDQFITETVEAETITAKKLCTAFGIRPPQFLEGAPDAAYYPLLGIGISREFSKRLKLSQHNTLDDAVDLLKKARNIIVLTGAGVSIYLGAVIKNASNTTT